MLCRNSNTWAWVFWLDECSNSQQDREPRLRPEMLNVLARKAGARIAEIMRDILSDNLIALYMCYLWIRPSVITIQQMLNPTYTWDEHPVCYKMHCGRIWGPPHFVRIAEKLYSGQHLIKKLCIRALYPWSPLFLVQDRLAYLVALGNEPEQQLSRRKAQRISNAISRNYSSDSEVDIDLQAFISDDSEGEDEVSNR